MAKKKARMKGIDLSRPFMVIKRGKVCRKPYHKRKYLYLEKSNLQSRKGMIEALDDEVRSWDDGQYYLRAPEKGKAFANGSTVFAKFQVEDGQVDSSTLSL